MTYIRCSAQYAQEHPERKPVYTLEGDDNYFISLDTSSVPSNASGFYVPAYVEEDTLNEYVDCYNQYLMLQEKLNKIKSDFSLDCDAYNSVGDIADSYSLTSGKTTMSVKESCSVSILDGDTLNKAIGLALTQHKPIAYTFTDDKKDVLVRLCKGQYAEESSSTFLATLGSIYNLPIDVQNNLPLKLRKTVAANTKVFATILNVDEDKARELAEQYDYTVARDNIEKLCSQCHITVEEMKKTLLSYVTLTQSQTVTISTSKM